MKETRSHFIIRVHAAQRLFMWHYLNRALNLVLVTEHPKSGGSWYSQLLSRALNIPFPRNVRPKLEESLLHGHLMHHANFGKTIAVFRDGRDIMTSAYYHLLFENDRTSNVLVAKNRKKLNFNDFEDVVGNMPRFIEFMFGEYASNMMHFSWTEFVRRHVNNKDVQIVKYEDLLINVVPSLQASIKFLGRDEVSEEKLIALEEEFSFSRQSNRKPGEEDNKSFLRKGIAGDWKEKFSKESCEIFDKFAGEELVLMGYEKDRNWF